MNFRRRTFTRICEAFLDFEETEQSKIFDNADFGYWKVTVEQTASHRRNRPKPRLQGSRDQEAQGGRAAPTPMLPR